MSSCQRKPLEELLYTNNKLLGRLVSEECVAECISIWRTKVKKQEKSIL